MTNKKTAGQHPQMATVTIEVPEFIRDAICRLSEETGESQTDILTKAINAYMMNAKGTR